MLYLGWIKVYMVMIIFACQLCHWWLCSNTEWLNSSCCCATGTIVDGIIARFVIVCHGYGVMLLVFVVMFVGKCKRVLCTEAKKAPLIDFRCASYGILCLNNFYFWTFLLCFSLWANIFDDVYHCFSGHISTLWCHIC